MDGSAAPVFDAPEACACGIFGPRDLSIHHGGTGSSTIDVQTARDVAAAAGERALGMVDAPVTGGVPGAVAGTLTMIVGGPAEAFERAKPYLAVVGGKLVHVGGAGAGQAVKICNNMMLAINMLGVAEAMNLVKAPRH